MDGPLEAIVVAILALLLVPAWHVLNGGLAGHAMVLGSLALPVSGQRITFLEDALDVVIGALYARPAGVLGIINAKTARMVPLLGTPPLGWVLLTEELLAVPLLLATATYTAGGAVKVIVTTLPIATQAADIQHLRVC